MTVQRAQYSKGGIGKNKQDCFFLSALVVAFSNSKAVLKRDYYGASLQKVVDFKAAPCQRT